MPRYMKNGFWMVLVSGAVAYLRYRGDPDPTSPARIYELLDELGFLEIVPRDRDSMLATIAIRLGDRCKGLIPD